ncbi:hypothetical protein Godav_002357 [Gossypium davidsonii]|uniref:Uncharacterized protein n=1 Tax=Gossypium davidsonii TaxID=34287 RepID=A0A7J8SVU6_GOSDV|nr:hypothetical protein [Gossypium davidsonii]
MISRRLYVLQVFSAESSTLYCCVHLIVVYLIIFDINKADGYICLCFLSPKRYQFVLKVRFSLFQAYSVKGRKGEMNSMQIYRKGTWHGDMMYIKIFKDDLNIPV